MPRVRFYVATSLDGFIADREGSVEWLAPYDARLYGYDKFLSETGALIMGRRTFELINAIGEDWPYPGKSVYVLSSHPLTNLPSGVLPIDLGLLGALQMASEKTAKDIWIVGGAVTMQAALDENLVDMIEIFLVPVLLGAGLSLLNEVKNSHTLTFDGIEAYPDGVVKLRYLTTRYASRQRA